MPSNTFRRATSLVVAVAFAALLLCPLTSLAQTTNFQTAFSAVLLQQPMLSWHVVAPDDEEFTVTMPMLPTVTHKKLPTAPGRPALFEDGYMVRDDAGTTYFVTSMHAAVKSKNQALERALRKAAPERPMSQAAFDDMIFKVQQSYMKMFEARGLPCDLSMPRDIFLGAHMGRQYTVTGCAAGGGMLRFYATPDKFYTVGVIGPGLGGQMFLDSFRLKS